jgi:hypothetical protein
MHFVHPGSPHSYENAIFPISPCTNCNVTLDLDQKIILRCTFCLVVHYITFVGTESLDITYQRVDWLVVTAIYLPYSDEGAVINYENSEH